MVQEVFPNNFPRDRGLLSSILFVIKISFTNIFNPQFLFINFKDDGGGGKQGSMKKRHAMRALKERKGWCSTSRRAKGAKTPEPSLIMANPPTIG